MADRFDLHVVSVLWVVDLPLDSYSIKHRDALALDQSDFVTFVDISNSVATDTDRGQGGRLKLLQREVGNLNIYLSNSTRVIKKPPRVGAGV